MTPPMFLKSSDVAKRLSVTETTLARWREQGKGPPWVQVGERFRYDSAAFDAWLASRPHGGETTEADDA